MDKYAGTWEWKSGNSSFTIVLKRKQIATGVYLLNGWYRYIKNGQIVIDKLNKVDSVKHSGLSGYAVNGNDTLTIIFSDETRNKLRNGIIFFVGGENRILIHLTNNRTHSLSQIGQKKIYYYDTLPTDRDIELTRMQ